MSDETESELTPRQRIEQWRRDNGVQFRWSYVPPTARTPKKLAKGEKPWRCLQWRVTLIVDGRDLFYFDYLAGEAHCPSYKQSQNIFDREAIDFELETGKQCANPKASWAKVGTKDIEPDGCDILFSLAGGADVIEYADFESWAECYGYSADSREAERTYRLCLEQTLKLQAEIGADALRELRTACEGY